MNILYDYYRVKCVIISWVAYMYSNEYVLFLLTICLTICLTLFNLKDLAVTEKSITFAKELTITIKIGGI